MKIPLLTRLALAAAFTLALSVAAWSQPAAGGKEEPKKSAPPGSSRPTPVAPSAGKPAAERPPLLKVGTPAPDFTAEKSGGGELKLADYQGKIVILDFWATWCGPCQRSMPNVEKVYQAVKGQGVVVVGVCVWDKKDAYEKWIPKNKSKYTFQFAFDPEGRGENNIATKLYHVSGIPTTYVIGKDGKVAAAIVGSVNNDKRLEEALKKLGVKVD